MKLLRHLRWFWQRRTLGFDSRDMWSLDFTIIEFVYPRLKYFREHCIGAGYGYPADFEKCPEKWPELLDEILVGFKILVDEENYPHEDDKVKKVERAMDLFREYFFALWT